MEKVTFFRWLSRSAAAVTAAVCTAVISAVGYYGAALPDSYRTEYGSTLTLNTALPITAQEVKESRAVYSDSTQYVEKSLSLKLFGSVPIKEVKEKKVERPVVYAGGQAFGIKLVTDGVMIIDLKKISGSCPAKDAGLKVGDVIEAINGERVTTNSRVSEIIKESGGEECVIKFRRGESESECTVKPVLCEGSYRAGMWVRDSSAGIGTLTFIDPTTGVFAGLGHAICDADTGEALPLSKGSISKVKINGCDKSEKGDPGQLIGEFSGGDSGELTLNCEGGVYGVMDEIGENQTVYPLGFAQEVHEGSAYILAQVDSGEPQKYEIEIEKVSPSDSMHDMVIKVTDEKLIEKTGGIVQGMSGSPIIQDGRLIGAVTHVFVDDPLGGYAIFAETMYNYSCDAASDTADEDLAG